MKLTHKDIQAGVMKVQIDTIDDLWTLRNIIQPGDLVTATSLRTVEAATDKLRAEKASKKPMRLGVRVQEVEWHDFDDHLRVHGPIEDGPQDLGRHHTHVFKGEPGTRLMIQKPAPLQSWQLTAIKEAQEATNQPRVVLLAIDDSEAQFGELTSFGVRMLGVIPAQGQGKQFAGSGDAKKSYYDEVARSLQTIRPSTDIPVLVVGPGWWREEFIAHVQQKNPELAVGIKTDGTSQGGRVGLHEALKRGMLQTVAQEHRVAEDTKLMEQVLERIAKGGLVAYGRDEIEHAVAVGAVDVMLVTDAVVREGKWDSLLRDAELARARIHILATGHDAGLQLDKFGGAAALLRFALS